jgi:cell wall assembly regulator SMI1
MLFGPPTGELSVGAAADRITAAYFPGEDPEYPYLTVSTLGLATREPLDGAEPHELGIQRYGFHDASDIERLTRAFLAAVQRLVNERVVIAPERVVAIPELEPEFPGRALALVSDYMYTGPDRLPMEPPPVASRARWLLLRPIFGDELRWIRTMSQAQVARAFADADVDLEDSQRDALIVRLVPRILPSENEALPMASHDIKRLYASLEAWLKEHSQPTYADLQEPVSAGDLKSLEAALGQPLPAELKEALEVHDGQPYLDSYMLMPAARIQQRYQREMENVDKPAAASDGTCREVVWSKGWIPFAEDGGQNFFCIDLDPGKNGTAGQVIRWERSAQRGQASKYKSFGDWLAAMTNACLEGKVDVDDEGFIFLK